METFVNESKSVEITDFTEFQGNRQISREDGQFHEKCNGREIVN